MKKVKTNLKSVSVGDFIIKARNIQTHLNDPMFSSIVPTAGEVMPLVDEMESLQAQIQDGYTGLIEQRNEKRKTINTMFCGEFPGGRRPYHPASLRLRFV